LLLGALGYLGAFAYLYVYYRASSSMLAAGILAMNGVICLALGILSIMALWKLFKGKPTAYRFAGAVWKLVAGFTLWTLIFDGLNGWSKAGIIEVIAWSILTGLIAFSLRQARPAINDSSSR
jgi:hypothetical protein